MIRSFRLPSKGITSSQNEPFREHGTNEMSKWSNQQPKKAANISPNRSTRFRTWRPQIRRRFSSSGFLQPRNKFFPSSLGNVWPRGVSTRRSHLISQKVFFKSFCRSQLPHKSVNLSFILTNMKNEEYDDGFWLLQNNFIKNICEIKAGSGSSGGQGAYRLGDVADDLVGSQALCDYW